MRNKLLGVILITGIIMTACSSEVTEVAIEVKSKETEISEEAGETTMVVEEMELSKEEMLGQKYEYLLGYDSQHYDGTTEFPIVAGFNFPYKFTDFSSSWYSYKSQPVCYRIDIGDNSHINISTEQYNVTSDGRLEYYHPLSEDVMTVWDIEEHGEMETIYGPAKLYAAFDEYGCDEVAIVNINGYTVTVIYSANDAMDYSGVLEKLLPILFQEIEVDESKVLDFEQNNISVEDAYPNYMSISDYFGGWINVLGFNLLEKSDGWFPYTSVSMESNCYETYRMQSTSGKLQITLNEGFYNYYFGGRSNIEIEEKAQVNTPVGIARIFHVISNELDKVSYQEVAVVNNFETNIIFEYCYNDEAGKEYGANLEILIPKMLSQ